MVGNLICPALLHPCGRPLACFPSCLPHEHRRHWYIPPPSDVVTTRRLFIGPPGVVSCDPGWQRERRSAVIPSTPFKMRNSSPALEPLGGRRGTCSALTSGVGRKVTEFNLLKLPPAPSLTAPPGCGSHHRDTLLSCLLPPEGDQLSRCMCDPATRAHPGPSQRPWWGAWPQDERLAAQKDQLPRTDKDTPPSD